jgi:hypothetical protein
MQFKVFLPNESFIYFFNSPLRLRIADIYMRHQNHLMEHVMERV